MQPLLSSLLLIYVLFFFGHNVVIDSELGQILSYFRTELRLLLLPRATFYWLPDDRRWHEEIDQENNTEERGTTFKLERELKRLQSSVNYKKGKRMKRSVL